MSQQMISQLVFRPASEKPTAEMDDKDVLLYNPCDGWHIGHVRAFEENGEVYDVGIYNWLMKEYTPHDFYIAWALLEGPEFAEKFAKP